MSKILNQKLQVIMRDGKPSGVVLDINDFEAILERIEDLEDLEEIKKIRAAAPSFRSLEEVLERRPL